MPIYEYVCEKCGKLNEVFQKVNDPAPEKCDGCNVAAPLTRVVSRTSFVLKGGGWYSDLYGSSKKDSKSTSTSKPAETASKPAAETTTTSTPAPAAKAGDAKT